MSARFTKRIWWVITLTLALPVTGCVPGLSHTYVSYSRNEKQAPTASLGDAAESARGASCRGSVGVYRDHGVFYLLGPDGPWWGHASFYGMYFKEGIHTPQEFYLMVSPDRNPVPTCGVTGKVVVQGRHVLIDVEYKDTNGRWRKLPVNGCRKVDLVFPDDWAGPKPRPQTQ